MSLMQRNMYRYLLPVCCLFLVIVAESSAYAQGSIFGNVYNSDSTIPANGEISFFGYLDDTDEEIRIDISVGAGYDGGFWYDDFQNYLTEQPGNPYDFHFYNTVNGEGFVLSKSVPNNSFQQENILLAPVTWPSRPTGLDGITMSSSSVLLFWDGIPDAIFHVYRRAAASNGSFYRIDDTTGALTNSGVADSFFVDTTVDGISGYDYMIIAEDASGNLSPHSDIFTVLTGDIDAPRITAIMPDSGPTSGGMPIAILGHGFDLDGATATIDGNAVDSALIVSPFEITGILPPGTSGAVDVVVTNTASGLASSPLAGGFTYFPGGPPAITEIPDQTIDEDSTFAVIHLDDYVVDPKYPDSELVWTYSGNSELLVDIDENRIATITIPAPNWFGVETILFRVTNPDLLFDEDTVVFRVVPVNDYPVISAIPDQAIIGEGAYSAIALDDYVDDPDHDDAQLNWESFGTTDLSVDITDHVATVSITNPDWLGTGSMLLVATDPELDADSETVTFVQVKVTADDLNFDSVAIGHPDSVAISLITPAGFTLTSPDFGVTSGSIAVHRQDGGAVDEDIPPETTRDYWVIWAPTDTLDGPGTVTIESPSCDDNEMLLLSGQAVILQFVPTAATYDFGDVNAVDSRAADTSILSATIHGNTAGRLTGVSLRNTDGSFAIIQIPFADTLIPGTDIDVTVVAHPQSETAVADSIILHYEIDLPNGMVTDSMAVIELLAMGVAPSCVIVEDTVDFGAQSINQKHWIAMTMSNVSTVPHVLDSVYFNSLPGVFGLDPAITYPFYLMPGDTTMLISFQPPSGALYIDSLTVVDSLPFDDCSSPIVKGTGKSSGVDWVFDASIDFGIVDVCSSPSITKYGMANVQNDFGLIIESMLVDSSTWFAMLPDPAILTGVVIEPFSRFEFSSISFTPHGMISLRSFDMVVIYRADTAGARLDTAIFPFVDAAGACAGILNSPASIAFGTGGIGQTLIDTMTIANSGSCVLRIDSAVVETDAFTISSAGFPLLLSPGEDSDIEILFMPTDSGLTEQELVIYHNGYEKPFDVSTDCPRKVQTSISLTGTGVDITPPAISGITVADCGRNLDLAVSDGESSVLSVILRWRAGNAIGGFATLSPSPVEINENLWRASIPVAAFPDDSLGLLGYEIRVIAADEFGNTDSSLFAVGGCMAEDVDGGRTISSGRLLGGDGSDSLWHLITIPGHLPSYRVDSVFSILSGLPVVNIVSTDTWRLYEYHNGSFRALRTNGPADYVTPGRGYWFRHIQALDTLRLAASGTATTWPTMSAFAIDLDYGWNLIGSPFLFPVRIDDRLMNIDSVNSFLRQTTGAEPGGSDWWEVMPFTGSLPALEPWRGYAVWCENPNGYTLYLDPHYDPAQGAPPDDDNWIMAVELQGGGEVIGRVDVGMHELSTDGADIQDVRPVGLFGKMSSMTSTSPAQGSFIRDIRAFEDISSWTLDISTDSERSLRLVWSQVDPLPGSTTIMLHDAVTGQVINMAHETEYSIPNPRQLPPGRLTILAGNKVKIDDALGQFPGTQPRQFAVYQNYPNPFNAATTISYDLPAPGMVTIEVYNLLGQKVATVESDYKNAGSYQVTWDGRSAEGRPAASGIYFARVTAERFTGTLKMMLLK